MRIATVVGARPQFVKASPVGRALRAANIQQFLIHTGQHYDHGMSQVFFDELGVDAPDLNLGIGSGTHAEQTAAMLLGLERAFQDQDPACVLIYGDTNSTLAGALAAAKLHIPVAHVEAGLRSFNRRMPEEINRIVADSLSSVLFAPTVTAVDNLIREGAPKDRVHLVGDVMYDAALMHAKRAELRSSILEKLGINSGGYLLVTLHRAENTDDSQRLQVIIAALRALAEDYRLVWPLHPRTRAALQRSDLLAMVESRVLMIEPVGYLDMVMLERQASLIITDSGGVQKEAFFHRIPCVTLRDETEWVETVGLAWNRLAPPTDARLVADTVRNAVGTTGDEGHPYGNGKASVEIAAIVGRHAWPAMGAKISAADLLSR